MTLSKLDHSSTIEMHILNRVESHHTPNIQYIVELSKIDLTATLYCINVTLL